MVFSTEDKNGPANHLPAARRSGARPGMEGALGGTVAGEAGPEIGPDTGQAIGRCVSGTTPGRLQCGVFYKNLARDLLGKGYSRTQLLNHFLQDKVSSEENLPVTPLHEQAAFLEHAAKLTGNDLLGQEFAQTQTLCDAGLIGYLLSSAATVADALFYLGRFASLFSEALTVETSQIDEKGLFTWQYQGASLSRLRQCNEFTAALVLKTLRRSTGQILSPRQVYFSHMREENREEIEDFYGTKVAFGARQNMFAFSSEDLSMPLYTHDSRLLPLLLDYASLLMSQHSQTERSLVPQVEREILQQLASGGATLNSVAKALGMSGRSLSRKLAQEDTSFFKLLEALRRALALRYMRDQDMTQAEIAFQLGFSSLSSFHDAFKRWTGSSPGKYRNRSQGRFEPR